MFRSGCFAYLALFLFFPIHLIAQNNYDPDQQFSVEQLKSDLSFLKNKLESIHPALYRYTPKPEMERLFDSLAGSISRPMNEQEFLGLICLLNEKIRDGHTMFLPSDVATTFNASKGKFFPFSIYYTEEKLFITENNSNDSSVHEGDEIVDLNEVPASAVMNQLLKRQIRDGFNLSYPIWILNRYFSSYYSFSFGQPSSYLLRLRRSNGEQYERQIEALERSVIRTNRQTRYGNPDIGQPGKGIYIEDKQDSGYAVLVIKSFDKDIISGTYKQNFNQDLASAFLTLNRNGMRKLILDLRDNQGGDFETGRYLLSFLVAGQTKYLVSGGESRTIQPKANRFDGRLLVLINGGSFSNSAIVSSILQKSERAIFIGEESGGNQKLICGDPVEKMLPATKINIFISTKIYRIRNDSVKDTGVIPEYVVKPSIEDLIFKKDVAKSFAIQQFLRK